MPSDSAGKTKAAVAVKLRRSAKQMDSVDFFTILKKNLVLFFLSIFDLKII